MSQPTEKNQIRIFIERAPEDGSVAGWMAAYVGPHKEEILNLFGTDTLPLPFMSATRASVVIDTLQRTHPGVEIVLRDWVEVGTRPYVVKAEEDAAFVAYVEAHPDTEEFDSRSRCICGELLPCEHLMSAEEIAASDAREEQRAEQASENAFGGYSSFLNDEGVR
jgi:hypothetical protein